MTLRRIFFACMAGGLMAACLWFPNLILGMRLDSMAEKVKSHRAFATSLPACPQEGNAYYRLAEAAAHYKESGPKTNKAAFELYDTLSGHLSDKNDLATLQEWITANSPSEALLLEAVRERKLCVPHKAPLDIWTAPLKEPDFFPMGRLLCAHGVLASLSGEQEKAAKLFIAFSRFIRLISQQEPSSLQFILYTLNTGQLRHAFTAALQAHMPTEVLQGMLRPLNDAIPPLENHGRVHRNALSLLHFLLTNPEITGPMTADQKQMFHALSRRILDRLRFSTSEPYKGTARSWIENERAVRISSNAHPMAKILAPITRAKAISSQEAFDIIRIRLAVEIYRRQQGHLPNSLDTLTPGLLPEVPMDPYSGLPYGYWVATDYSTYDVGSGGLEAIRNRL